MGEVTSPLPRLKLKIKNPDQSSISSDLSEWIPPQPGLIRADILFGVVWYCLVLYDQGELYLII